jgi:hypothetical protein
LPQEITQYWAGLVLLFVPLRKNVFSDIYPTVPTCIHGEVEMGKRNNDRMDKWNEMQKKEELRCREEREK